MRIQKYLFIGALFLSGCVSTPKFQRLQNGVGYSVVESGQKDHFKITTQIPSGFRDEYRDAYRLRAVGEECARRGYSYFSSTDVSVNQSEAFCFATAHVRTLGLAFNSAASSAASPRLIVEAVDPKVESQMKVGDEVLAVDGQSVHSLSQLKPAMFAAGRSKKGLVRVRFLRSQKTYEASQPFIDSEKSHQGPEVLAGLRKTVD